MSASRLPAALLCAALLVAAGGCTRKAEPPPSPLAQPTVAQRVRVLNADVLVVDGANLRLAGVYAPQPLPYARCWAEALAAREATRELRQLIDNATAIAVRLTGARDAFNRQVAFVTLDRLDLGGTLYDLGLVAKTEGPPFRWCAPLSDKPEGAPTLRSLMDFGT